MNHFLQTPSSSRGYLPSVGSNTDLRNNRRSGASHSMRPPFQDLQQQLFHASKFQGNQQAAGSARDYYNDRTSTLSSHHDSQRGEWERTETVQKRWLDKSKSVPFNFETNVWVGMDTLLVRAIETSVKQTLLQDPVIAENVFMLEDEPRGCIVTRSRTDQLLPVVRSNGMKQLLHDLSLPTGETWQRVSTRTCKSYYK